MTALSHGLRRKATTAALAGLAVLGVLLTACGGNGDDEAAERARSATVAASSGPDGLVKIGRDRKLYVRCTGTGSPTVLMEGGDEDTSDSYAFAEPAVAKATRTCVYDRGNLGRSGPAPGPRGLDELVGDLEQLLKTAQIPGPYVLVGTSGGGFITAGYASEHPDQVAGMVFIDTGAPLRHPPREIVEATDPSNPENVERRDYLQVERDAWAARKRIGDIPLTVISVEFSDAAIKESPFPAERKAMRRNVDRQRGWLILSPRAKQIVAHTSHAVEEDNPDLVIDAILDVVEAAQ
jgi:pimeloyl-ACP methyl ester carboxylesterase